MGAEISFSFFSGFRPRYYLKSHFVLWSLDHDLKRAPAKRGHLATFTSKNFDAVKKKPLMVKG